MLDWTVSPEWSGETVYIVAGGPSVAEQDPTLLRGRKLIVVNSSYERFPQADILFFGDFRWHMDHYLRDEYVRFLGRKVTTMSEQIPGILRLKRDGTKFSFARDTVMVRRTSLTGAINLAVHLGAAKIVLLGADGGPVGGKSHHHIPHPWEVPADTWKEQADDLRKVAAAIQVPVLNASPASALDMWPRCRLEEAIE